MKGNITKTGPPGSHRLCGSKTLKKRERERDRGFSKTSTSADQESLRSQGCHRAREHYRQPSFIIISFIIHLSGVRTL